MSCHNERCSACSSEFTITLNPWESGLTSQRQVCRFRARRWKTHMLAFAAVPFCQKTWCSNGIGRAFDRSGLRRSSFIRLVSSACNGAWNTIVLMLLHSWFTLLLMGVCCASRLNRVWSRYCTLSSWSICTMKVCLWFWLTMVCTFLHLTRNTNCWHEEKMVRLSFKSSKIPLICSINWIVFV